MKSIFALLALVTCGHFAARADVTRPLEPTLESAATRRAPLVADLRSDFQRSHRVGDRAGMTKLVRDNSADAASWLHELAAQLSRADNEENAKLYESIGRAWADAFATGFSDRVLGYWKKLTDDERTQHFELSKQYYELSVTYFAKREEPMSTERNAALRAIGDRFDPIAQALLDLGEGFYSSRAWMFSADTYKSFTVGNEMAVPARELEYLRKAYAACVAMDIGDRPQHDTKSRITALEAEIARGSPGAGGADPKASGPAKLPFEFGAPSHASASALRLDDPKKYPRLAFGWDDVHPTWTTLKLGEVGSTTTIPGMVDGPTFEHQGLLQIVVTDADGKSTFVKLSTELQIVTTRLGKGDNAISYSFGAKVGSDSDDFQGFPTNLQSSLATLQIYIRPAASVAFDVGGTQVHVLDDNLDGVFGGPPTAATATGLAAGALQPALDSVLVGKSRQAVPFSEVLQIGKEWYRLTSNDGGRSYDVSPAVGVAVGSAKLDYKGADLDWVVVRGTGDLSSLYFRLEPGKDVPLPAGNYQVYSGVVRDGQSKALMLVGEAKSFAVDAGASTSVPLGAPYSFAFSTARTPEGVKVKGGSVRVIGAGGEEYQRYWISRPKPEVYLRKAGTSTWSRVGQLELIDDIEELGTHGGEGWNMVWWPLDGLFENKFGDDVEVRLLEKKNRLFGKIDSALE